MQIEIESNEIFRPVHLCKKRYIIMKGSAGSGKSVDTAQQYILRLMSEPGRNLICMRKSEVSNRDSTFAELVSVINKYSLEKYWKITSEPLMLTCINGNSVIFRGMNDAKQREKLKSVTFKSGKLTDVWMEEMTEFTQEDFEIVDDRLRGVLPNNLFYQIKGTFNPVSANHWIKKVFFDIDDPNVLTHQSTYLNNRFIDEGYLHRMERRKKVDPDGYRIYGLGEWGEAGGLILNNFKTSDISTNLEYYDDIAIGQDFGFNHANAILLLGFRDSDVYILKEIYVFEKDTSEIISLAEKTHLPKNKFMWCDSAEPDRIKMWVKAGYKARGVNKNGAKGSVAAQIDWLKMRRIYIHPSCVNTAKELSGWKWKKDPVTNEYIDEPVPILDDACAALRYGTEGWRKNSKSMTVLK